MESLSIKNPTIAATAGKNINIDKIFSIYITP
jgi:hypothetical protein